MGVKVLVIDDEKLLVKSTCIALSLYDFETKGALNGEEGIKEALTFNPDIILLDIMMPLMDGWEVLEGLKNNKKTNSIPVVIFTAKEHSNGEALARSKGAVDYIAKPFELEQLIGVIKKHISGKSQ